MADGSERPIEAVRPGDEVLSCWGGEDFRPARVTAVSSSRRSTGVEIVTRGGRRLVSTPEHVHFAGRVVRAPGPAAYAGPAHDAHAGVSPEPALANARKNAAIAGGAPD